MHFYLKKNNFNLKNNNMIFSHDPRNGNSNDPSDSDNGNDSFPDIPTNDRGQLTDYSVSPDDYPDFGTIDVADQSSD